ncbi:MAG: recombinase family protein [Anaerolineae bacterium]|nr:recombinase family protein [Anaerolineae bacterium]
MSEKRAIIYARVSGDDTKKDGRNLDSQIEMGREYCKEHDYTVIAELTEDIKGASGASWNLPKLNQALEMARNQDFDVLVVRELDRFARRLAKQLVVEEEFQRLGVSVEYVLASYDDTPEGTLTKNVRAVIAEYEREKTRERLERGKRNKIRQGHVVVSGHTPFGYRKTKEGIQETLVIHEKEAAIVRAIFDWYTVGARIGMRGTAQKLNAMNVPTSRHDKATERAPKWYGTTVRVVLSNPVYYGVWTWDGLTVAVPAIVSQEQWNTAQERIATNKAKAQRNRKAQYLLSGHLRCGDCNASGIGRKSKSMGHRHVYEYWYYRCGFQVFPNIYGRTHKQCQNTKRFRVEWTDRIVWERITQWLLDLDKLVIGLETYKSDQDAENQPLYNRLEIIHEQIDKIENSLARLVDLHLEGDIDKEEFKARKCQFEHIKSDLEQERQAIQATIKRRSLTREQIDGILAFRDQIIKCVGVTTFEEKRQVLDTLKTEVVLVNEDNQAIAYIYCVLGFDRLRIEGDNLYNVNTLPS